MGSLKSIIKKGDMADNAEAVREDGELISMADGFGIIHHPLEHEGNVVCETEFETGKEGGQELLKSRRNLVVPYRYVEKDKKGIGGTSIIPLAERKFI
jgi:hypothetical protein